MDRVERMLAVLAGARPDRPPVGFWCHFPPDQVAGPPAVRAHLDFLDAYDLDFLKVMNDNGYPAPRATGARENLRKTSARGHAAPAGSLRQIEDLNAIVELRGDEPEFARQLKVIADLRRNLDGRVLMTTTVFNAWAVLRQLIRPPAVHRPPVLDAAADEPSARIRAWLEEDSAAVRGALERISRSLAHFAARCLEAGADGIFLSVRDDWVNAGGSQGPGVSRGESGSIRAAKATADDTADANEAPVGDQPGWANLVDVEAPPDARLRYAEVLGPLDREILAAAARGQLNILHVCGRPVDFRNFARYPVHALNWADRAAGPSIAAAIAQFGESPAGAGPAICAGVDNLHTLPNGTAEDCAREVADALHQAGERPIIIAPGCTFDPQRVSRDGLEALVRMARAASYTAGVSS